MTPEQYENWRFSKPRLLAERVQKAKYILWDFDIPICSLFSSFTAPEAAQSMRDFLYERNLLQEEDYTDLDPLAIYRRGMRNFKSHRLSYLQLEMKLKDCEILAATIAKPNVSAMELMEFLEATGRRQAIVTNNCPQAVQTYLEKWDLTQHFRAEDTKNYPHGYVFGRSNADPKRLKPNPLFLEQAMKALGAKPEECLMVGDSITDFEAAKAAKVPFLGYTLTPDRAALLYQAGADIVIKEYIFWYQLLKDELLDQLVVAG
jgi:phosphoglycolate phosphatase-like HAD superfamily hydrolase